MLKKYWNTYWKLFCAAVFFVFLEAMCSLLQPTIVSNIIDIGVKNKDINYVLRTGLLMILVTAVGSVMAISRNILSGKVSQRFARDLRYDLYKKIQYMPVSNIDTITRASLITRITNDVTQLQTFANGLMRVYVKAPILCFGALFMAMILSPELSAIFIAIIPVLAVLILLNIRTGYPRFKKVQQAIDNLNSVMREFLSGIRVVKAFNRSDYEEDRFNKANLNLNRSATSAMRLMSVFTPLLGLCINIGIVAVLWFGGLMIFNNNTNLEVGKVVAFVNYMIQIFMNINIILNIFNQLIRAMTSHDRIKEVMDIDETENIMDKPLNKIEISSDSGELEFKNVYFSYHDSSELDVLTDISFTCHKGETVGIIGSTGSGKTSLTNLMLKYYKPKSGEIFFHGENIDDIDVHDLRYKIAYISQEVQLFSGTIQENISWGKKDASKDDVVAAAKIAQAHDFIMSFPNGYDTYLGQHGVNLSGGQKQRISIARAVIRKPEILIMDDSTSAVDFSTESLIKKAINEYSKSITTIMIAQRIHSISSSNQIIILDKGKISAIGTHKELMAKSELYREIYRSQIGEEE